MEFTVSQEVVAGFPVVKVQGEIDVYSAPALKDRINGLFDGGQYDVVVDLSQVQFLDSTGLGALVSSRSGAEAHGGRLPIVCKSDRILKLFTITGLDKVFVIVGTVDEAVAALGSGAPAPGADPA